MGNSATALTEAVYYILLSLVEPRHGYAIMQHVEAMSRGRLRISAGTMYGALSGLIEKGSSLWRARARAARRSIA